MPVESTEPIDQRLNELRRQAAAADRDPASIELVIYGSGGDPAQLEHYEQLGVALVVLGLAASNVGDLHAQLDHHQSLIDRFAGSNT